MRPVDHAAAPTLSFTLEIDDRSGREVFAVALTIQIQLEPIKRKYDDATRERLVELFGEPGRWATTARRHGLEHASRSWCTPSRARPRSRCRCSATTTSSSLRPGTSALFPTARCRSSGTSTAASTTGGADERAAGRADPVGHRRRVQHACRGLAQDDRPSLPQSRMGRARRRHGERLGRLKAGRGLHTVDQTVNELLDEAERKELMSHQRRRRANQLAALRGLRALSLHAGCVEELHTDAVRDRLSARPTRSRSRRRSRCCGSNACCEADPTPR